MLNLRTPKTADCPEIGKRVPVDVTEWACRAAHGCEQPYCPLEAELRADPLCEWIDRPLECTFEGVFADDFDIAEPALS